MAHLVGDPKDIAILKAYWVNHAIDQNVNNEYGEKNNKRQSCVGIYGIDIHPDGTRFATCGADQKIKIWSMAPIISVNVEVSQCVEKLLCICHYDQTSNTNNNVQIFNNTIHCVKWSNSGEFLASGAADGIVTIWKLFPKNPNHNNMNGNHNTTNNKFNNISNNNWTENWNIVCQLTKHRDTSNASNSTLTTDVQDITWNATDTQLISAGSDHNIIIWSRVNNTFACNQIIRDGHADLILGLSFDPIGDYLLTQSADGTAKVWSVHNNGQYVIHHTITAEFKKRSQFIRKNASDDLTRLDVCQRGSWSPCGKHLLTSFGVTEDNVFISPIFARNNLENEHCFVGHTKPTTVSKWNPRIYRTFDKNNYNKYEMFNVAAVGSMDRKVSIWCTNKRKPLIVFTNIGKESVLDLAWSRTGDILLACTHDGNVMAFIFGKSVFKGYKLSIDNHIRYINYKYKNQLHTNILNTIRNNITLANTNKFNDIKPKELRMKEREIINENSNNIIENDNDIKMETQSNTSTVKSYIPNEECFGPQEEIENGNINIEINKFDEIKFDAYPGKQSKKITHFYEKEKANHNNSNGYGHGSPSSVRYVNGDNSNGSSERVNDSNSKQKKKKKKRKREDKDNDNKKSKKRKYNDRIKIDHFDNMRIDIKFNNKNERGVFRIKCNQNKDDMICNFEEYKVMNENERLLFKIQIPTYITQIVCNEKWTICGSLLGEIFVYDNCGRLIQLPMQLEEEIVLLYMSELYYENNGNMIENSSIYLMIITSDCVLRLWKLNVNMIGFKPINILKTNFNSLLNKNKKCLLKNGCVTKDGKVILTLTNDYIYMYEKELDLWMRMCDNKYALSIQRNVINNNSNNNNNISKVESFGLRLSELIRLMNVNVRENSNNNNNSNNSVSQEEIYMNTIGHLEHELMTLCKFKNREIEFENIMKRYIEQLINSLEVNTLCVNGIGKLDKIFNFLLNWNVKENDIGNDFCGGVLSQRKLLNELIQNVKQRNNNNGKTYFLQLQQLTNKYTQALNACQNDII